MNRAAKHSQEALSPGIVALIQEITLAIHRDRRERAIKRPSEQEGGRNAGGHILPLQHRSAD